MNIVNSLCVYLGLLNLFLLVLVFSNVSYSNILIFYTLFTFPIIVGLYFIEWYNISSYFSDKYINYLKSYFSDNLSEVLIDISILKDVINKENITNEKLNNSLINLKSLDAIKWLNTLVVVVYILFFYYSSH